MRSYPLLWGTLYIVSIPLFAAVYWALPTDSFFHGSLTKEQEYIRKHEELSSEIEKLISSKMDDDVFDVFFDSFEGANFSSLQILNTEPDSSGSKFKVVLNYFTSKSQGKGGLVEGMEFQDEDTYQVSYDCRIEFPQINASRNLGDDERVLVRITEVDPSTISEIADLTRKGGNTLAFIRTNRAQKCVALFGEQPNRSRVFLKDMIYLDQTELNKLIDMYYIHNGRPGSSYLRMLYFSSTTITTLGYGDIVPTSTASRMLTGLQSVLGIVLIGLYLNSIVKKND